MVKTIKRPLASMPEGNIMKEIQRILTTGTPEERSEMISRLTKLAIVIHGEALRELEHY
ncbi:MAG: hypothetical protein HY532_01805 [Chloroflexi bacterium]|nr:hypothetical protein [Chloroflexota bacterium]